MEWIENHLFSLLCANFDYSGEKGQTKSLCINRVHRQTFYTMRYLAWLASYNKYAYAEHWYPQTYSIMMHFENGQIFEVSRIKSKRLLINMLVCACFCFFRAFINIYVDMNIVSFCKDRVFFICSLINAINNNGFGLFPVQCLFLKLFILGK